MRCSCKVLWKCFSLYFPFSPWRRKISQVHYPSSIAFSQLWRNSFQLARLFKVKVALSPDLNTVHWFAKIYLSTSEKTRALVGFCSKTWTHNALKVDFFLSGVYRFFQINSSYVIDFFVSSLLNTNVCTIMVHTRSAKSPYLCIEE